MSQTDEDLEDLPLDPEEGEEEDEEEEEEEEEEEHSEDAISVYDSDTFISGPAFSEECTIPEDILEFHFSFGYDCRRYFNLTVADPDTLVFASGNLINFLDVPTKTISFRRSALGGGIGHIKANPNPEFPHIAVAENGEFPLIIIYEWPTMEIDCVLKEGSSRLYSHMDFSPDGLLLVSQGGEPDYLITVWNWPKRKILLRTKSYVNDVNRVKFSPYVPGQLTTCGISHIKFWKMARTFTGLKLKGDIGRFGKTEFSDILGVLPMPDEKVVSGSAWGNILIWDAGLIKLEVFRTLRRKCHEAPIVQIYYEEGELLTVSMDGHVKIWWYEKIDQADPPDDDRIIQIEPTYDFYTPGLMLMCLRKRYPDPTDSSYFGQDGNGGVWIIDLNTEETPKPSVQIYKCHAGKVMDMAACPWGAFLASFGQDGRLYLYDYLQKRMIFHHQFPAKGACMIWISPELCKFGDEIVLGFDDGSLRLCILQINTTSIEATLDVIQITKPHNKPVTKIAINRSNTILVSGGEDKTIFIFKIDHQILNIVLVPIGFIPVPNIVTCLTLHNSLDDSIFVGCLRGEIVQVMLPYEPQNYTEVSFLLQLECKHNKFTTYKAQIRRDIKIREIEARKAVKVAKKRVEMEKLKKENPGFDIDEEVFLADSESEEELEPLHIPEIPNRILWMQHTEDDTLWLSMGGYDAGYIYEYKIEQKEEVPFRFKMVHDADDIEISSYLYNYNKRYLIFAMQDGTIRVNKLENADFTKLADYWTLPMHDNENGFVPVMCFSFDEKFFFSCGHDGNVFSYYFNPEESDYKPGDSIPTIEKRENLPLIITDETAYDTLSLEEASLKKEQDRIDRLANRNKEILRDKLKILARKFYVLTRRNLKLLPSQVIPGKDLELDPRITEYLEMKFEEELALVKRKLAFDVQKSEVMMVKLRRHFIDNLSFYPIIVRGLNSNVYVKILRQRNLAKENDEMLAIVDKKIVEAEIKSRPPERPPVVSKVTAPKTKDQRLEYFLVTLSPSVIEAKLGTKLTRILEKYRDRKLKWEKRDEEWEEFNKKKPVPGVNPAEDELVLAEAKRTIGDYKLKSSDTYKVPKEERVNTVKKYKQLLQTREKQYNIRHNYNEKVYALRDEKILVRKELQRLMEKLLEIQEEIPEEERKEAPPIQEEDPSEFPERNLEITEKLTMRTNEEHITTEIVVIDEPTDYDGLEKQILPSKAKPPNKKDPSDINDLEFAQLVSLCERDDKDTPWECEIRSRRLEKKLFQQNELIYQMNKKINDFNSKIQTLFDEKFQTVVDAKLMDLFMVTLQQELIILKDFEALEEDLQEKVNEKTADVLDMQDLIQNTVDQIAEHHKEIEKQNEEGKHIQHAFTITVQDNKFFEFLKKVFKKKYKPPKVHRDDESSSESSSSESSSSEEDDDGRSIDSRDFGIIKQDLNVCPKGCDPAIYEYTVNARSRRHQVEIKVREETKAIELLKKDMEMQNKKIKMIEKTLEQSQEELERFQREKQHRLNEVRGTVVLRLHQLQHLTPTGERSNINDVLVFSQAHLSHLYKRVEELQTETEQQRKKHQINIRHLTRMNTDCKYMKKTIKQLKDQIVEQMKIKFGKVVDINEIEEAMLKRTFGKDDLNDLQEVMLKKLVHDLKLSLMDIKGMYMPGLNHWTDMIAKTQKELAQAYRNSTALQELLTMLHKEKTELSQTLALQERKRKNLNNLKDVENAYHAESERLEAVLAEQNRQVQELKDEIKMLRTKGLPPKPIRPETEETEIRQWDEFHKMAEDGIIEEETEEHKPFSTEIIIPRILDGKSQDLATELLKELVESLNVAMSKRSIENFIKETVNSVMRGLSMTELMQDLIKNLPIKPDDEQSSLIEATAEQLYILQEGEVTQEEIYAFSEGIIEDIVEEILLVKGGPSEMISSMLSKLVDQLPYDFLQKRSSINIIIKKLLESKLKFQLDRKEMAHTLRRYEARKILDSIMETVYDTGVDLLYYIDG